MPFTERDIQISYANALKKAKSRQTSSCCTPSAVSCCPPTDETTAETRDTISVPVVDQEISFGCLRLEGFITEHVKPGMTVIDFGSGPGHDLFLAARAVGQDGKAIGVDMTDEMINEAKEMARENGLDNVELVKSNIEDISLPDDIADVIVSNCVINLASNKSNVFREAYRLLKPGGKLLDADVISTKPLSDDIKNNKELWCSCVGGALTIEEHQQILEEIGFEEIKVDLGEKDLVTFDDKDQGILSGLISAKKPT
ncbi:MAG: methyltransferase domain-containing protein [Candidatus Hodarchaeales archaeon]